MRGRIYDPAQRRFLTPDPFVPDPLFSQSYNRYAYVLNNPIRYTDPSGFQEESSVAARPPSNEEGSGGGTTHEIVKTVRHPTGTTTIRQPKPAASDGETESENAEQEQARKDAARANEISKQQFDRKRLVVTTVDSGGRYHPHTEDGRMGRGLWGADRPPPPDLPPEVGMAFASMVPGSSLLTVLDPNATSAEKAAAVALDVAGLVGVGAIVKVARGAKAVTKGVKAGAAGVKAGAALSSAAKDGLRTAAREIWRVRMGKSAASMGLQVHHRIPLEYGHLFPKADPNRAANLIGVAPHIHEQISGAWSAFGRSLNGRTPTPSEVMGVASAIDQGFADSMVFLR